MKPVAYKIIFKLCLFISLAVLASCDSTPSLQPLKQHATILAFGDSLTYGTGSSRDKAYPAFLENITGLKVINAGIPGEVSAAGLARLPALLREHQPDLIIICHGGNDILRKLNLKQTQSNIQSMINIAQTNHSQVILVGVPEFGLFLATSSLYLELAKLNKLPIASDILGDILSKNKLKSDQIHPNAAGYQLFAERIATLLNQSGALPTK